MNGVVERKGGLLCADVAVRAFSPTQGVYILLMDRCICRYTAQVAPLCEGRVQRPLRARRVVLSKRQMKWPERCAARTIITIEYV